LLPGKTAEGGAARRTALKTALGVGYAASVMPSMADLDGAVQWVGKNGGDLKKVGITGFCWGGRITWL
jgi:dienelactone hydrolase